jgi:hypothetical protein
MGQSSACAGLRSAGGRLPGAQMRRARKVAAVALLRVWPSPGLGYSASRVPVWAVNERGRHSGRAKRCEPSRAVERLGAGRRDPGWHLAAHPAHRVRPGLVVHAAGDCQSRGIDPWVTVWPLRRPSRTVVMSSLSTLIGPTCMLCGPGQRWADKGTCGVDHHEGSMGASTRTPPASHADATSAPCAKQSQPIWACVGRPAGA